MVECVVKDVFVLPNRLFNPMLIAQRGRHLLIAHVPAKNILDLLRFRLSFRFTG